MNFNPAVKSCQSHGWLDKFAISMSIICAVHCLVTPLIVTLLPIISTTFWVHENFHLWMVFLVVPTTTAAMFMGCRKHKDKAVASLGAIGLAFIVFVAIYQYTFHASNPDAVCGACPSCTQLGMGSFFNITNILNSSGGLFLACAHVRNYKLCRKARCDHD